jgi:4-hydroxy-tetrahydrodipicolinate synthase
MQEGPLVPDRSPRLGGIIPPVITPLRPDRSVDVASLARLIEWLVSAGVDGIFVLGSSGEAPFLTEEQRRTVIATAVDVASGHVPILAGVIDTTAGRIVPSAAAAVKLGADYLVCAAPFFALPGEAEVFNHFRQISDGGGAPVVIYQIPSRAGLTVPIDVVQELAVDGAVQGLKDSSTDFHRFRRLTIATADIDDFAMFTGVETLVDAAVLAGAAGAMPGLANIDPAGFVRVFRAAEEGDWTAARAEQERLVDLLSLIEAPELRGIGPDPGALTVFKTALMLRGVIDTPTIALDAPAVSDSLTARVRETLVRHELL